ncbi:MAG: peptidylprolyl isomerase [Chromatiales bacterium]|jgi:parvulin-like peptidyl-prolyl isomerase|nr:peptidylprolyl isomerase [Chromatiales bacterium]
MRRFSNTVALIVLILALAQPALTAAQPAQEDAAAPSATAAEVFAVIGGTTISVDEFEANFHAGIRQRFYHGQVPAAEIAAFRREVAQSMIDRVVLLQEAERRGIKPDESWVKDRLARMAERLAASADPQRERALLREQLLGDSAITRLKHEIENVPVPDRAAAKEYYQAYKERFTTPERVRLSLILLKVEPWAEGAVWEGAGAEAVRLRKKLAQGGDFSALARLHSADPSSAQGGDLGFVHRGMLSQEVQEALDGMKLGEISQPIRILQGFAIVRLDERAAPELNTFEQAQERATDLLRREQRERAWQDALVQLREKTKITVNDAVLGAFD